MLCNQTVFIKGKPPAVRCAWADCFRVQGLKTIWDNPPQQRAELMKEENERDGGEWWFSVGEAHIQRTTNQLWATINEKDDSLQMIVPLKGTIHNLRRKKYPLVSFQICDFASSVEHKGDAQLICPHYSKEKKIFHKSVTKSQMSLLRDCAFIVQETLNSILYNSVTNISPKFPNTMCILWNRIYHSEYKTQGTHFKIIFRYSWRLKPNEKRTCFVEKAA